MNKKNVQRGEGNRVAPGASVFDPNDASHVQRVTPMQTKAKQMMPGEDAGINSKREVSTRNRRMDERSEADLKGPSC